MPADSSIPLDPTTGKPLPTDAEINMALKNLRRVVRGSSIQQDKELATEDLYSDANLFATVKLIRRELLNNFDLESEEYQEELASKFYLLARRIRDRELSS